MYACGGYNLLSCEIDSCHWQSVIVISVYDQLWHWLTIGIGRCFSKEHPVYLLFIKTDHDDITKILLKMVLNDLNHNHTPLLMDKKTKLVPDVGDYSLISGLNKTDFILCYRSWGNNDDTTGVIRRFFVCWFVCLMVLNATFNNISVISWRSVLLVEEAGGSGENHRPLASHWQTSSHNVVQLPLIEIRTHNISGDRHWLHK